MRTYIVQPGDTPASIAASDSMAGCPKCARDFLGANPHKESVTFPNGYRTFKTLRAGEKLVVPEKWFTKEFDARPPAYFKALPHPDGVTPSTLGDAAAGVLASYQAIDAAAAQVGGLATLSGHEFSDSVNGTGLMIENAIQEVVIDPAASVYAQKVKSATDQARQINETTVVNAISSGDVVAESQGRRAVLGALSNALENARLALNTFYGSSEPVVQPAPTPPTGATFPANVVAAARAVASTMTTTYCVSVAQSGTPFNRAVHAFKLAWNASQSTPVPINTGNFEQSTADALAAVLGEQFVGCPTPRAVPFQKQDTAPPAPPAPPMPIATKPQPSKGLNTGAIVGLSVLGAGVVGGGIYLATRSRPRRRRRR